jgi:glycogen debranching enzyme
VPTNLAPIVQQARSGPLDRLGKTPFAQYYADYASPFDFIFALAHAYACQGEIALVRRHWDLVRRILDWVRDFSDIDGDGFLEYRTRSGQGPKHQGWEDSDNAMVYEDGRQVEPPITCEVQEYHFAMLQVMSVHSGLIQHRGDTVAYWRAAEALKKRFNDRFWLDDDGYIALAIDEVFHNPLPPGLRFASPWSQHLPVRHHCRNWSTCRKTVLNVSIRRSHSSSSPA